MMDRFEDIDFTATDDSGRQHHLRARRSSLDASTLSDSARVPGLIHWIETSDGRSVTKTCPGTYKIDLTGAVLRSDDSAAP